MTVQKKWNSGRVLYQVHLHRKMDCSDLLMYELQWILWTMFYIRERRFSSHSRRFQQWKVLLHSFLVSFESNSLVGRISVGGKEFHWANDPSRWSHLFCSKSHVDHSYWVSITFPQFHYCSLLRTMTPPNVNRYLEIAYMNGMIWWICVIK